MANHNPVQTTAFKARQIPLYGDTALGKTIGTRYPANIDAVLRALPDTQGYIRAAIAAQLRADGLI